jgi:DNA-binding winged helix-turn-helix (wHTH) protein
MHIGTVAKLPIRKEAAHEQLIFPARYARFGAFQIDLERQELFRNGTRVRVPGKAYQVLVTLLERSGEIVTREALRMRLWPTETHVNYDANVNTTVNKLRLILGDSNEASAYIETVPRKGYSFIAEVEFLDQLAIADAAPKEEACDRKWSLAGSASGSRLFGPGRGAKWFTAGVIALIVAAMLFGAALTLFFHRAI